jgi:hypothetical protein
MRADPAFSGGCFPELGRTAEQGAHLPGVQLHHLFLGHAQRDQAALLNFEPPAFQCGFLDWPGSAFVARGCAGHEKSFLVRALFRVSVLINLKRAAFIMASTPGINQDLCPRRCFVPIFG